MPAANARASALSWCHVSVNRLREVAPAFARLNCGESQVVLTRNSTHASLLAARLQIRSFSTNGTARVPREYLEDEW